MSDKKSEPTQMKSSIDRLWRFAAAHLPPPIDENSDEGKMLKHCKEETKVLLEIAGFFVGIVVAVIFGWQLWEMIGATNAAVDQAKETQRDFILDQRAWVFATAITPEVVNKSVAFRVEIKNSGKTPALNFRTVIGWDNETNDIAKIDTLDTNDFMVLAPGAATSTSIEIKTEYVEAIVKSNAPLWICGKNRYDDIFGKQHWSTFCWKVGSDLKTFYGTPFNNSCDDVQTNQTSDGIFTLYEKLI